VCLCGLEVLCGRVLRRRRPVHLCGLCLAFCYVPLYLYNFCRLTLGGELCRGAQSSQTGDVEAGSVSEVEAKEKWNGLILFISSLPNH
jgi:hypothetical protein